MRVSRGSRASTGARRLAPIVRAVVVQQDRTLKLDEIERPEPAAGQVRVRVAACGICGSDLHLLPVADMLPAGSILGHEFAGEVDAVGPGVEGVAEGDRVCVYPFPPRDGHDIEEAMGGGIGLGVRPGAYAEAVCVDENMLWRLPDGLELEHAALVEPLAVGLHGLNVGEVGAEDRCVVIGAGPIGIMTALALRARGVQTFLVVERNDARRARLERLELPAVGLDDVNAQVLERLGGPPRVVFECAGNPKAPGLAVELVASSGRIVLMGVLEEPVEFSQMTLLLKEGQMRASFAYRPGDFDEAIELIARGAVPVDDLVTARVGLDRAQEMFDELLAPATEHVKVLLRPSGHQLAGQADTAA